MIFVDTGPFLARYLKRDQYFDVATRGWDELRSLGERCVTTNFVLDEVVTLLGRRASFGFASERALALWSSSDLKILRPEEGDELVAIELLSKFSDQKVSFTDCVSFATMKRHRLRRAFTFDRHFEAAGFEAWPSER